MLIQPTYQYFMQFIIFNNLIFYLIKYIIIIFILFKNIIHLLSIIYHTILLFNINIKKLYLFILFTNFKSFINHLFKKIISIIIIIYFL